jgi:hypothetical protein
MISDADDFIKAAKIKSLFKSSTFDIPGARLQPCFQFAFSDFESENK